jgi:hypothetical protein
MVGETNRSVRLLRGSVVQHDAHIPTHVVCRKSRPRQRESDLPRISYNFESGWYVDCDPEMTYDWTADTASAWTIPMGADIGKAFKMGSQDLSLQAGAYDLLKRPDRAPQWIMRVSVTLLFPASRK